MLAFCRCLPAYDVLGSCQFLSEQEEHSHVRDWLFDRFVEKEELIEYFNTYHNFPADPSKPQTSVLRYPKLKYLHVLIMHVIAYSSFYLAVRLVQLLF